MAATLQVGSIGVEITVPLTGSDGNPIDLNLATGLTLYMTAPDGSTSAKPAQKVGSGVEGKMLYRTVAGDLHTAGDWRLQSRVQYASPVRDWYSQIYPLVVAPNLNTVPAGVIFATR